MGTRKKYRGQIEQVTKKSRFTKKRRDSLLEFALLAEKYVFYYQHFNSFLSIENIF